MQHNTPPCWACCLSGGIHRLEPSEKNRGMKAESLIDNGWPGALSQGLSIARERQMFTDLAIVTQDEVLQAHKVILAAASPYFSAMLTGGLMEGVTQKLVLEDIPSDLVKVILTYIYSGQAAISESNVEEVLQLADYFQLHSLKKLCCYLLGNKLKAGTCLSIYELARLYHCYDLSTSAFSMACLHCSDVMSHSEFVNVEADTILKLLDQPYLNYDTEEEVLEAIIRWASHIPEERSESLPSLLEKINFDLVNSDTKKISMQKLLEEKLLSDEISKLIMPFSENDENFCLERTRNNHLEEVLLVMAGEANGHLMKNIECFTLGFTNWQCSIPGVAVKSEKKHRDKTIVLPTMHDARAYCAVATNNNMVYVLGGQTHNVFLASVECYSVQKNRWDKLCPLPVAVHGASAAFLDGVLYLAGGKTSAEHENKLWVYDIEKDSWTSRAPMNHSRVHYGLASLHGSLYAIGGVGPLGANHQVLVSCERYDRESNSWTPIAPMSQGRSYLGVAVINDYLYAVGGYNGTYWLNSVERYDPLQDQWTSVSSMISTRSSFGITVSRGRIYCIGGFGGEANLNTVEKYNPGTNTWHCVQSMQLRRYGGVAATVQVPFLAKSNP